MAVKEVIWQDGQGSTPGTNSGDKITLQADAWSGTQQVTVQTPENFGIFRAMNIVFYSSADSTKTATLKVTQEAATASLSPNTVVFDNTETAAKTITLSTNISTLSSTSIALEGADASQFTLSSLSALSNGKATFTIKPNSVNQGTSSRNCSIKVTVGRLDVMNIPVEQLADTVVSTKYSNYRLDGAIVTYNGSTLTKAVSILAKAGSVNIKGTPLRDKKVTYSSGRVETTTEVVPSGNSVYYGMAIVGSSYTRQSYSNIVVASSLLKSGITISIDSLGYTLRSKQNGSLYFGLDEKAVSDPVGLGEQLVTGFNIEKNIRTGYSNYSNKNSPTIKAPSGAVSLVHEASAYGTCTYSSGASRTESVPMKFMFVTSFSWASIIRQTPGAAGTSLAPSEFVITFKENTSTSSRILRISALPWLADGSTGGEALGVIIATQLGATPRTEVTLQASIQTSANLNQTLKISTSPSTRVTSPIEVNYALKTLKGSYVYGSITLPVAQSEVTHTLQDAYTQVVIISLSPTEDSKYYYRF